MDLNNLSDGQKLRKITVIAYLNPDINEVRGKPGAKLGELRLYLKDRIVDVIPHSGRVIMFKSENVEHEVKPTRGYRRFALTSWYRHTYKSEQVQSELSAQDDKIFIGIPAYRDPELPATIRNLIENSDKPELLTFGVCF